MTRSLASLAALLLSASHLAAQAAAQPAPALVVDSATSSDTLFLRAQRMAAEGQGDAARALVQHEIDTATAGSPHYVDALYWRAVVAATAADAERDLRRIIIEFPLSPRNEDALLRLAQLEMTRGENDQALSHLQRLVIDHPASPSRARASFWMARVYFDKNQTPAACRSLADAAHNTSTSQVEQRNQIDFWMQRCHGMDTASVASTAGAPQAADSAPVGAPPASATIAPPRETVSAPPPPPPPPAAPASSPRVTASRAPSSAVRYTVQVAAYPTRAAADAMRRSLAARGYSARVVDAAKLFRVRVGFYDTRAKATAAAQQMKAKQISVYVTEAEPR